MNFLVLSAEAAWHFAQLPSLPCIQSFNKIEIVNHKLFQSEIQSSKLA